MSQILMLIDRADALTSRIPMALSRREMWGAELICAELYGRSVRSPPLGCDARPEADPAARGSAAWRALDQPAKERFVWTWLSRQQLPDITTASAFSNLVLCGPGGPESLSARLVGARVEPTVIIPGDAQPTGLGGRVMIAWDDGEAIRRTVYAVLPLLRQADEVALLLLENEKKSLDKAARFLAARGVTVTPQSIRIGSRPTEESLRAASSDWKADWFVMAAVGRTGPACPLAAAAVGLVAKPMCPLIIGR